MSVCQGFHRLVSRLGPGLLYAGAAVGVSHLVQSTRAGGMFGFYLIAAIIIIHLVKYPFFEFGPRYTAATGKNLLHGYKKLGNWALWVYFVMTLLTMFIIQAAVTVVTAGLAVNIFGLENLAGLAPQQLAVLISALLLALCFSILASGRYALLDGFVKVVILVLSMSSVAAVCMLLLDNPGHYQNATAVFSFSNTAHLIFLATFLGWMPAPMDISVWHSIWSQAKNESDGQQVSMADAMFDFRVGYIGTGFLAICFLLLGALVMYGSGQSFSTGGSAFAGQLLQMYEQSLGSWSYPIVAVAALTTMFSTTLTLLDAFPRSLTSVMELLFPERVAHQNQVKTHLIWLLITVAGSLLILFFLLTSMSQMVKIATVIAFVAAPIFASLNTLVMFDKDIPEEYRPGRAMLTWCVLGLIALTVCSISYLLL